MTIPHEYLVECYHGISFLYKRLVNEKYIVLGLLYIKISISTLWPRLLKWRHFVLQITVSFLSLHICIAKIQTSVVFAQSIYPFLNSFCVRIWLYMDCLIFVDSGFLFYAWNSSFYFSNVVLFSLGHLLYTVIFLSLSDCSANDLSRFDVLTSFSTCCTFNRYIKWSFFHALVIWLRACLLSDIYPYFLPFELLSYL